MRYTKAEKLEIIRLVEGSDLPVKKTLEQLQISRSSFYRWYRVYVDHGANGLASRSSCRHQFWNRIPDSERERVVEIALAKPELSARELAWHITDNEGWFISERSVYRILKSFDLLTSPAYIVISAADEFKHKTSRVHESLDNVTPADVYHDRHREIQTARQLLKMQTLRRRRWYNHGYELKDEELIRPSLIRECVY